jgi:hypothetical protein
MIMYVYIDENMSPDITSRLLLDGWGVCGLCNGLRETGREGEIGRDGRR